MRVIPMPHRPPQSSIWVAQFCNIVPKIGGLTAIYQPLFGVFCHQQGVQPSEFAGVVYAHRR
ncbi:MAG: hypothetical protein VX328_04645, partial [Candidatus Thermoplasmatota archaeon]|nr:hypothetical protein [Candidatus Thermoplasmatota archaeon]